MKSIRYITFTIFLLMSFYYSIFTQEYIMALLYLILAELQLIHKNSEQ